MIYYKSESIVRKNKNLKWMQKDIGSMVKAVTPQLQAQPPVCFFGP